MPNSFTASPGEMPYDRECTPDDREPEPLCFYCNDPMPADLAHEPYCSTLCALYAERDSLEDI